MTCDKDTIIFHPIPNNPCFIDRTGRVYGRLTVLGYAGKNDSRGACRWYCECTCGNITNARGDSLADCSIRSCGCLRDEAVKAAITTHGCSRRHINTPEYRTYISARSRCVNPHYTAYHRYGGRGIEFRFDSFEDFFNEVGTRPTPKHTLDRINNDGHYERGNIRWATRKEQAYNRSTTKLLTFEGKTQSITEWGEDRNVTPAAIGHRLKRGWSVEEAITGVKIKKKTA